MAFKTLKEQMASLLPGVGTERVEIRAQGCWNCSNFDREVAAKLWWDKARGELLEKAVVLAMKSPLGEKSQPVVNIREMVPKTDAQVTGGVWGSCKVGRKPNGDPVGDFVHQTYLCGRWSGVTGASIAREGEKLDKLPEELMEDLNNPIDPSAVDLNDPTLS